MWVLRAHNIIFVPAATRTYTCVYKICICVCVCLCSRARIPMGIPGNDTLYSYSLISSEIYIPTVVSSAHASRTVYIAVVVVVVPIIYFIIIIFFLFFSLLDVITLLYLYIYMCVYEYYTYRRR